MRACGPSDAFAALCSLVTCTQRIILSLAWTLVHIYITQTWNENMALKIVFVFVPLHTIILRVMIRWSRIYSHTHQYQYYRTSHEIITIKDCVKSNEFQTNFCIETSYFFFILRFDSASEFRMAVYFTLGSILIDFKQRQLVRGKWNCG